LKFNEKTIELVLHTNNLSKNKVIKEKEFKIVVSWTRVSDNFPMKVKSEFKVSVKGAPKIAGFELKVTKTAKQLAIEAFEANEKEKVKASGGEPFDFAPVLRPNCYTKEIIVDNYAEMFVINNDASHIKTYVTREYLIGKTGLMEFPLPNFKTIPYCGEKIRESEIEFSIPGLTTVKDGKF
jgi:hypothetical protein